MTGIRRPARFRYQPADALDLCNDPRCVADTCGGWCRKTDAERIETAADWTQPGARVRIVFDTHMEGSLAGCIGTIARHWGGSVFGDRFDIDVKTARQRRGVRRRSFTLNQIEPFDSDASDLPRVTPAQYQALYAVADAPLAPGEWARETNDKRWNLALCLLGYGLCTRPSGRMGIYQPWTVTERGARLLASPDALAEAPDRDREPG